MCVLCENQVAVLESHFDPNLLILVKENEDGTAKSIGSHRVSDSSVIVEAVHDDAYRALIYKAAEEGDARLKEATAQRDALLARIPPFLRDMMGV